MNSGFRRLSLICQSAPRSRAAGEEEEEEEDAEEAVGAALHHVDGDVVVPPCQEKAQAHPAAEGTTSPWGASSCVSV